MRGYLFLLAGAVIWGFSFVAQRASVDATGAFSFNAARFLLGALSLLPVVAIMDRVAGRDRAESLAQWRAVVKPGLWCGALLFGGATLQQLGIVTTTAGNAAFVTGLYMVLIPLFGLALGHRTSRHTWLGIVLALAGLYLLTVTDGYAIVIGDLLCLGGTVFWAVHILVVGHYGRRVDPVRLSAMQFAVNTVYSAIAALLVEPTPFAGLAEVWWPVVYAGIVSVGIGFTFQVIGQRDAKESHAAMIMSTESLWGLVGGALLLGEVMTGRGYLGAGLMLTGIMVAQLEPQTSTSVPQEAIS